MPKATARQKRDARDIVLARDQNTCQRCGIDLLYKLASVQHRRPKGAGGSALLDIPSNLVLVCGSATTPHSCHNWMEHEDRPQAVADGWLIPKLSPVHPSVVPVLTIHGWVTLDDEGGRFSLTEGRAV
jgi:5-methylcytosine-specific restriction protein A